MAGRGQADHGGGAFGLAVELGARIAPQPGSDVLGALGGTVVRFKPGDERVQRAPFFYPNPVRWDTSYGKSDVVMWTSAKSGSFALAVHRAPLEAANPLSVETRYLGEMRFETHSPRVGVLDDGTRLFVGEGTGEMVRVYRLPLGGELSAPAETNVRYVFGGRLVRADGKRFGYQGGRFAGEVDSKGARSVGTLEESERLRWNADKGGWQACFSRCRTLGQ